MVEKEDDLWGNKCNTILLFIRHGERADQVNLKDPTPFPYPIDWDPPLTALGVEQAKATGKFLKEAIPSIAERPLVFISSPFTRTMQTIGNIIGTLNLQKTHQITVTNALCEELNRYWFPLDPQFHLPIRKSPKDFTKNYLEEYNIQFADDKDQTTYNFPESGISRKGRIYKFCKDIFKNVEDGSVVFCGVHGYGIIDFCTQYGDSDDGWEYCALYAATGQQKTKPKLLFKNIYSPYITKFNS